MAALRDLKCHRRTRLAVRKQQTATPPLAHSVTITAVEVRYAITSGAEAMLSSLRKVAPLFFGPMLTQFHGHKISYPPDRVDPRQLR